MDWLQSIGKAIDFIECNIENKLTVDEVAEQVYTSSAHFQRIFNLVTGITLGEYIRNRRLSLAGRELYTSGVKVIDVALKYQYDTPESFAKAFTRFHGINPSEVKKRNKQLRFYYPLVISISIRGGFDMTQKLIDAFYWKEKAEENERRYTDEDKYKLIADWACRARGTNPNVFDELTDWILNDEEWTQEKLEENRQVFMQGVLGRFKQQNAELREYLTKLIPSGVVNMAVFQALDRFDSELSGQNNDKGVQDAVKMMFEDFSVMTDRGTREKIAGNRTGSTGTDSVELFGYVNRLKECDAGIQWTLFMPFVVERMQKGFHMTGFEYRKLSAVRFIGFEGEEYIDKEKRAGMMQKLDSMEEYKSGFDYDLLFMHFYGQGVDVGQWHGVFGRFMKADTPVPEGYIYFDFIPENDEKQGPPYISQFAFATFEGDVAAMHKEEGYDGDAMYDTTRNTILAQGKGIPYPAKYWTAEVYLEGCCSGSTAYMFSTIGE